MTMVAVACKHSVGRNLFFTLMSQLKIQKKLKRKRLSQSKLRNSFYLQEAHLKFKTLTYSLTSNWNLKRIPMKKRRMMAKKKMK